MLGLEGKVAIVTGASRGIGRAIAERLTAEGALVAACDVIPFDSNPFARALQLDVASESDWATTVSEIERTLGGISILVNNAGITTTFALHETSVEEWERVIAVDQTGVFLGMRSVIPSMQSVGGGAIVNISSILGAASVPGIAAYHAAKGAVLTMTKNAAVTYASSGIRANAILPGWIKTPMTAGQSDDVNGVFLDATPIRRAGEPADIAAATAFLVSDEASFITGVDLPVDGGYLAQ